MRFASTLNVHLSHLKHNWQQVQKLAPQKKILFMVKANAYGHGIGELSEFAVEELKAQELGVATLGEALYLRKKYPHLIMDLYVFSETELEKHWDDYLNYALIPVLHNLNDLDFFLRRKKALPICLKFNTGMNRLGIDDLEVTIQLLKKFGRSEIYHCMTHFSESYLPITGKDRTSSQIEKFKKIQEELDSAGIKIRFSSSANSGAIEQNQIEGTHVRPGLMMYGPSSLLKTSTPYQGKNISELITHVLDIRKVGGGSPIGYGSTVVQEKGIVAILPIGYGDGIHTHYTGSSFSHLEFPNKIVGRVNMDMTYLFVPESHVHMVKIGQELKLWTSDSTTVNDFANANQTHAYQIFCGISSRIPRVYLT